MRNSSARLGLAMLVVLVAACGTDEAGTMQPPADPADTSVPSSEATDCCASDAVEPTPTDTTQPNSADSASVTVTTTLELATTVPSPSDDCGRAPSVELRGDGGAVVADFVYFQESSPTCGYNGDGVAMFDSSFRPDSVVVASDGFVEVVVGEPGDVRVDIRELLPNSGVGVGNFSGPPLVATDGVYSLALPGSGCFVITIEFDTNTRNGQFIAVAASSADIC